MGSKYSLLNGIFYLPSCKVDAAKLHVTYLNHSRKIVHVTKSLYSVYKHLCSLLISAMSAMNIFPEQFDSTIAQSHTRRILTAKTWIVEVEFFINKVTLGADFFRVLVYSHYVTSLTG
jgi:hypothetical protein